MRLNKPRISDKAARFSESVIREMTRLANRHNAINLAQGFPNFPAPDFLKEAACRAIQNDINQYAITWGSPRLRRAISEKYLRQYAFEADPDREITVCCGATECMIATILALVDPGGRVAVFEPFYENYGPDAIIAGAAPTYFQLDPEREWAIDFEAIERSIQGSPLRALILNTPQNPTGKTFTQSEMERLAELAVLYDFYVITDEIYEHILYSGRHMLIAQFPGMRERTVTISGLSKTFSVTGWRLGYVVAPEDLTSAVRKIHDFLTVGAAAPLQEAAAEALESSGDYFQNLAEDYRKRRDFFVPALRDAGFRVWNPQGAYYVMTDISDLTEMSDVAFVRRMVEEIGVAAVPGSSFFQKGESGRKFVRFAFCKTMQVLEEAAQRLSQLRRR